RDFNLKKNVRFIFEVLFDLITIILAEAEIELIPDKIRGHPAVVSSAKKRGKKTSEILLDSNFHHRAMQKLNEKHRRGRPDISHIFLLTVLESIANKKNQVKTFIHTRNNEVLKIDSKTRIMRNYSRYMGLLEQLFKKKVVPNEKKPLLSMRKNMSLDDLIKKEKPDYSLCFSSTKKTGSLSKYFTDLKNEENPENILCLIGGFPKGDFSSNVEKLSDDCISIFSENLTAWTIANEVLVNYNNIF
ncbi:MAG: hypothetical protein V5A68_08095, partial [Candidatus Thermoplasmatota archaeon]